MLRVAASGLGLFLGLVLGEAAARVLRVLAPPPVAGAQTTGSLERVNLRNEVTGYEPRPHVEFKMTGGSPGTESYTERLGNEGFRGPDAREGKAANLFRVLAVGDSVVQGLEVAYENTWEKRLQDLLSQGDPAGRGSYEVLNAGVGGYVSWQAYERYVSRGVKYAPEIVILHVGWNDMGYSTLDYWQPRIHLGLIMDHLESQSRAAQEVRPPLSRRLTLWGYEHSALLGSLRDYRNRLFNERLLKGRLETLRKESSGTAFNEDALKLYVANLERFREQAARNGSRLVLLTWPTICDAGSKSDPRVEEKMIPFGQNFPLTFTEFVEWKRRYSEAIRSFASTHSDCALIDLAAHFEAIPLERRIGLFVDHAHLGKEGSLEFAATVHRGLLPLIRPSG